MSAQPRLLQTNTNTRLLYDRSLSEWTSKYQKNKRELAACTAQCDLLRHENVKLESGVGDARKALDQLEQRYHHEATERYGEAKDASDAALQQKQDLANKIAEHRKLKSALTKEKSSLSSDYDRKYAELTMTLEKRGKLDEQLAKLMQQLLDVRTEYKQGMQELNELQEALKENTALVDELQNGMMNVREGIKSSVEANMMSTSMYRIPDTEDEDQETELARDHF